MTVNINKKETIKIEAWDEHLRDTKMVSIDRDSVLRLSIPDNPNYTYTMSVSEWMEQQNITTLSGFVHYATYDFFDWKVEVL